MADTNLYKFTTHRTLECEYNIEASSEGEARELYFNGLLEDDYDVVDEKIETIEEIKDEPSRLYMLTTHQIFRAEYAVEATSSKEAKSLFEANPGGHDIMHSELLSEEVDTVLPAPSMEPAVFGGFRYLGDGEKAAQRAFAHEVDMLLGQLDTADTTSDLPVAKDRFVAHMNMVFEHYQALWGVVDFDDPRFVKVELGGENGDISIGDTVESAIINYSPELKCMVRVGDGTPAYGYGLTNWGSVGRGDPQDM